MKQLEIEYKTMLSKEHFQQLQHDFRDAPAIEQVNIYFDTPDFDLKAQRSSLRVRLFQERAELTLKTPETIGNLEHNQQLTPREVERILSDLEFPRGSIVHTLKKKQIPSNQLKNLGSLKTIRREKKFAFGLLALDENGYRGQVDYELEVEVVDAIQGKLTFERFLRLKQIPFLPAKSKIARFCSTL